MANVIRVGFPCRLCNRPNAVNEGGGALIEGLPIKSQTPGDSVFCAACLKAIALFIEESRANCETVEREIQESLRYKESTR